MHTFVITLIDICRTKMKNRFPSYMMRAGILRGGLVVGFQLRIVWACPTSKPLFY
jgi:hypothetical protein